LPPGPLGLAGGDVLQEAIALQNFSELGLSSVILRAVEGEGYSVPTPIQAQTIPHVMAGKDVVGCAQTGTGKTAAFALPVLHRLMNEPVDKTSRGPRRARALVLSPTRELAAQIADSFAVYGRETGLSGTVIFGGVSQLRQEKALARGVDIIVATPGRLIDLMEQRLVDLSGVNTLILDEADRMLDMGFIQPIRRIAAATPKARQTLLFSATMPKEVAHLAAALLRDPVRVATTPVSSAAPKIEQGVFMVSGGSKQSLLQVLLGDESITSAVVFTKTKHGAERVGKKLMRAGVAAETIHGNKNQNQRKRALDSFRSGRARVLVATDVAARGLDVDGITHVINFDLPMEPEAYVHRIGRTGRAGATGVAVSFCAGDERGLLKDIERLLGKAIAVKPTPELPKLEEPREERRDGERPRAFEGAQASNGHAHRGGHFRAPRGAQAGGGHHRGWKKKPHRKGASRGPSR
jgi:ATP-dependent RNA helicase RhlE